MDFATRLDALRQALPDVVIEEVPSVDQPALVVPAEAMERVARQLREHPSLQFQVLAELTAADYWPREPRFEIVYHFVSMGPALGWRARRPQRLRGRAAAASAGAPDASSDLDQRLAGARGVRPVRRPFVSIPPCRAS